MNFFKKRTLSQPQTPISIRPITTADTSPKPDFSFVNSQKGKRNIQFNIKQLRTPQLSPPSNYSTIPAIGTEIPTNLGKEYTKKFEDYINGSISCMDVIKFKNILLTQKPEKIKNKKIMSFGAIQKVVLFRNSVANSKLAKQQEQKKDDEQINKEEVADFIRLYDNSDNQNIKKLEKSPNNRALNQRRQTMKILGVNVAKNRFQRLKNVIEQRKQYKNDLHKVDDTKGFKIIDNFKDIAEVYRQKIQNNDLIKSDFTAKFYSNPNALKKNQLSQITLVKPKIEKNIGNQIYQGRIQNLQEEQLRQALKKAFTQSANKYIDLITNEVNDQQQSQSKFLTDDELKKKAKATNQLSDEKYTDKLQRFITSKDQLEKFQQSLQNKDLFIQHISNIDTMGYKLIEEIYDLDKDYETCPKFASQHNLEKIKRSQSQKTARPFKYTLEERNKPQVSPDQSYILSDDDSLVSETEVNLARLYEQSKYTQRKILNKNQKINKLMNYFLKIEKVQENIQKVNFRKLK